MSLSTWPKDCGCWERCWWLLIWPISLVLFLTVPDCRQERWRKWYPITFLSCIFWIAITSYLVAWMITVIGQCSSRGRAPGSPLSGNQATL